jgi:hypothetical protein
MFPPLALAGGGNGTVLPYNPLLRGLSGVGQIWLLFPNLSL